jgi:hypothetical protein
MDRSLLRARDEQAESGFRRGGVGRWKILLWQKSASNAAESSVRIGGDGCQLFPKRLIYKANFSE